MSSLNYWVSDNLQSVSNSLFFYFAHCLLIGILQILGASDENTIEFCLASAKSATSPSSLISTLRAVGLPSTRQCDDFITDLFRRIHPDYSSKKPEKKDSGSKPNRQITRYELLLDEEDSIKKSQDKLLTKSRSNSSKVTSSGQSKSRRRRDSTSDEEPSERESESEKESVAIKRRNQDRHSRTLSDDNEVSSEDEAAKQERDAKERDEFADRLKKKDKNKSLKEVSGISGTGSEHRKRKEMADDVDSHQNEINELRKIARQRYLSVREEQQLVLLEKEVQFLEEDAQRYGYDNLSRKEQNELKYKKEILEISRERKRLKKENEIGEYDLPEDYFTKQGKIDNKRREKALYQRYKPVEKSEARREDEAWELEQRSKASITGNRKKKKLGEIPDEDKYEYVFDTSQHIDFEADNLEKSNTVDEQEALAKRIEEEKKRIKTIEDTRKSLPVYEHREQLLEAIRDNQVLIVVGETGSGKTTQLPQFLHEAGYTKNGLKVGCTQPRRVAAMSVAARVAEEMGTRLGGQVGYTIRFEDKTSEKTVIKYMTDGMLLREFLTDPELSGYSALMIDEAHERTLSTDILFGLLKDIAKFRPELRLLISSATLNAKKFSEYFDGAPIYYVPGRRFEVDIHYTKQPEANYLHAAITTVFQIHVTQKTGDILVFLTGQDEIEMAAENLAETARKMGKKIPEMLICPIYANLPQELQAKIFEPTPKGARKVVLATNIAETSITIDGIVFVIDTGFVKENVYNPKTGMESLVVTPCSRASADQRAGRAGRVGPGKCFRLYTKWAFYNELPANATPEILRTNLGSVVLLLMSLGINDILNFDFLDSPPVSALMKALELLYALGALNDRGELTKIGRQMAEFPTDPMLAKTILASNQYGCTEEVLSIVAMLGEAAALFFRPKEKRIEADKTRESFTKPGGDHLTLLEIYNQWVETEYSQQWAQEHFLQFRALSRARDVRDQLERLCDRVEIEVQSLDQGAYEGVELIQKSIASGFFPNAAKMSKTGDSYQVLKTRQTVHIHPSSVLFGHKPQWLLYHELVLTSKEFMRNCMPIDPNWLKEVAPHYFKAQQLEEMGVTNKKLPKQVQ